MLLCLSDRDSFLRQLCIAAFFAGHRRINERKPTDSAQIHQCDQYHLRGNVQLRRNTQCQSHGAHRRRCFIQAGGQWEILIYADKNASAKEQRKLHRQNGRGVFDGTAIDSAPKELGAVPLAEGRGSIGKQNCQRGGFHAACGRAGAATDQHQQDDDGLP